HGRRLIQIERAYIADLVQSQKCRVEDKARIGAAEGNIDGAGLVGVRRRGEQAGRKDYRSAAPLPRSRVGAPILISRSHYDCFAGSPFTAIASRWRAPMQALFESEGMRFGRYLLEQR